ncbi:MAG: InlB B-repeat-containing protein [Treponema sp.]|nr:InlB B-repeat-containing protein [Treponema sp.]
MKTRRNLKLLVPAFLTTLALVFTGCDNPLEDLTETTYYTVTFNSNGGSDVEAQKVESGTKATKPTDPTKASTDTETYAFGGWYTSTDDGTTLSDTAFDFETAITADITLYAKWNASAKAKTDEKSETPEEPEAQESPESPESSETPAETYTITIAEDIENGSVTASKTSGIAAGETVTITATPADGYKLASISVKNGDTEVTVTNSTFTMPAANVTVSATFEALPPNTYSVTIAGIENGSVTSDKTSATAGETVTLTITPADYYKLNSISATSNENPVSLNGDGNTRTFTMPAANVSVTARFVITKIGTKKMPNEVGDIVFNDGTALPASEYSARDLTTREKENAIAVVADVDGGNAMAVGLKQEYLAICSNDSQGYTNTDVFNHDGDAGQTRQEICYGENDYITDYSQENYPAIYWAQHYKGFNNLKSINNDWFIPTKSDLEIIRKAKAFVIAAIDKIGSQYAQPLINPDESFYHSVTQSSNAQDIWDINLNDVESGGMKAAGTSKDSLGSVLVIRYFYCGN